MKRTFLSNEEIIDRWDAAINKNIALDRLAIACRTDRSGMKAKLRALGVTEEELEAVPTAKPKRAPDKPDARKNGRIDPARARELYDAGKNDVEIAAELGINHNTVYAWRKRNGLKANAAPAFQRKKKEEKTVNKYKERETENAAIEAEEEKALAGFEPVAPKKQGGFKLEPKAETEKKTDAWDGYTVPAPVRAAARETMTVGRFVEALGKYLTEAVADAELRVNGVTVEALGFDIRVENNIPLVNLRTREVG